MKIGLHDDNTGFPNLALMKISAHHKANGDTVSRFFALETYDRVYSSKVFTFTQTDGYLPEGTVKGGTGYDMSIKLDESIEHIMPDYSLYGQNYSMGFLTRGCIRKCSFCFVPKKEGHIRANADINEFLAHRDVVLLDNNVLAHPHGIEQIEKIARLNLRVDFNQGIDARLIGDKEARLLSELTWLSPVRLACDSQAMIEPIRKAVELLRWHNVTPFKYFCYCLVNDIDESLERVKFLKGINIDPFCQPFMSQDGKQATEEQKRFCRWVNHKAIFNTVTWEEYKQRKDKL